jgi:hypothetical protein
VQHVGVVHLIARRIGIVIAKDETVAAFKIAGVGENNQRRLKAALSEVGRLPQLISGTGFSYAGYGTHVRSPCAARRGTLTPSLGPRIAYLQLFYRPYRRPPQTIVIAEPMHQNISRIREKYISHSRYSQGKNFFCEIIPFDLSLESHCFATSALSVQVEWSTS